jgi:hypothetical protein
MFEDIEIKRLRKRNAALVLMLAPKGPHPPSDARIRNVRGQFDALMTSLESMAKLMPNAIVNSNLDHLERMLRRR